MEFDDISIFLIPFIILWLFLTLIYQPDTKIAKKIANFDKLGFIPKWTFFAPSPSYLNISLLYRFSEKDYQSEWFESDFSKINKGKSLRCIFNPRRRVEKFLHDFIDNFSEFDDADKNKCVYTTDYLSVLKFIQCSESIDDSIDSIQFMIVGSNSFVINDKIEILFVSAWHSVGHKKKKGYDE